MKRTIRLIIALAIVMAVTSSCKTKQKIAEIPAGATIEASSSKDVVAPPTTPTTPTENVASEKEVTRNENFSLVDGESSALNFKYHVVVGSFSKQENARGLQSTLKSEGNSALIVVNEKGLYRVLISSFNDYNQAHARIKQISGRFADAWVLVKK
jgi:cell division protein FtsN